MSSSVSQIKMRGCQRHECHSLAGPAPVLAACGLCNCLVLSCVAVFYGGEMVTAGMTLGPTAPLAPVEVELPPPYPSNSFDLPPQLPANTAVPPGMCLAPAEFIVEQSASGSPLYPSEVPIRLRNVVSNDDYRQITDELQRLHRKFMQPPWYYIALSACCIVCKCLVRSNNPTGVYFAIVLIGDA